VSWLVDQRKRFAAEFAEGDGVLSLYRQGLSTKEELQFLLALYFSEAGSSVPGIGRLLSGMNVRQFVSP
jgi:hypothetical protein